MQGHNLSTMTDADLVADAILPQTSRFSVSFPTLEAPTVGEGGYFFDKAAICSCMAAI